MFIRSTLGLFGLALCAFCVGCRSTALTSNASKAKPQWQCVTVKPKADRDILICRKLNPMWWLGNIDSPNPPEKYRLGEKGRRLHWKLRNLCHNFTFYVIGIADKESERVGYFPERVFNPNGGWNVAFSQCGFCWLPFASYERGGFKFYFGWRDRGNFGFKLNF